MITMKTGKLAHATEEEKAMHVAVNKRLNRLANLHYDNDRDSTALGNAHSEVRQSLNRLLRSQLEQAWRDGWLDATTVGRIDHSKPYTADNMVIESKEDNAKEQHDRRRTEVDRSYVTVIEKKCSKCGVVKSAEEFTAQKGMRGGLMSQCMECINRQVQEYKNTPRGRLSNLLKAARRRCKTNTGYILRKKSYLSSKERQEKLLTIF